MGKLTTQSTSEDFAKNLMNQTEALDQWVHELAKLHRNIALDTRVYQTSYNRDDAPDEFSLKVAFSSVLAMLSHLVSCISEAEDALESLLDDESDAEDITHAQGELFAYKSAYMGLIPVIAQVESIRIKATLTGYPSKQLMWDAGTTGLPNLENQPYAQQMPTLILPLDHQPKGVLYYKLDPHR